MKKLSIAAAIAGVVIGATICGLAYSVAFPRGLFPTLTPVTRFEKLTFVRADAINDSCISVQLRNTGTTTAYLETINISIDGKPVGTWQGTTNTTLAIKTGDNLTGLIRFPTEPSGRTFAVILQTTYGNKYQEIVTIP